MHGRFLIALACASLVAAAPAQAYWGTADVGNLAALDFSYKLSRIQMRNAERAGQRARKSTPAPLPTEARARQTAAREMAQAYPAAQREQAAALFETLLTKYGEIEDRFGIRRGDIGGALAAFIAGNLILGTSMRSRTRCRRPTVRTT